MPEFETIYRSYLLRLWHNNQPGAAWRIMLESVNKPGQRHYFKNLNDLTVFLASQQQPGAEQADMEGDTDI